MKAYTHPSGHLRLSLTKEEAEILYCVISGRSDDVRTDDLLDFLEEIEEKILTSKQRADLKKHHEQEGK